MKRRNFIGGLVALPFVGKLLAKEAEAIPIPPVDVKYDCGCFSTMDCPSGTVCREISPGVSRCEPLGKCDCECNEETGRCVPADGYIEFSVPMSKMGWEMQVTAEGWHYKKIKFVNKNKHSKTGKMLRKIKNSHKVR